LHLDFLSVVAGQESLRFGVKMIEGSCCDTVAATG
jgi:hypothetical protein